MSYTYLQEQGEESSAATFSDIPVSVLSKSTHSGERFYSNGSETEFSQGSPSGMTCEPSTANPGARESILSRRASRATTSVRRDKKAGIDGAESSLFVEVCRIAAEIRPKFIFLENSGNLVGRGLARVLSELAKLGYDSRWCRLGAGHIGADHERLRTWIVSNAHDGNKPVGWDLSGGRRLIEQMERNMVGQAVDQPWIMGRDHGLADRMDRLATIGAGQVPAVAALAWRILTQGLI